MIKSLTLVFDELPPGPNGKEGVLRMYWTERNKLMHRWHMLVRAQLDTLDLPAMPLFDCTHPCTATATRVGTKLMDWDNFGASLKPVLDGLVKAGALEDDSPEVIRGLALHQARSRKGGRKPCLAITLTAVDALEGPNELATDRRRTVGVGDSRLSVDRP